MFNKYIKLNKMMKTQPNQQPSDDVCQTGTLIADNKEEELKEKNKSSKDVGVLHQNSNYNKNMMVN